MKKRIVLSDTPTYSIGLCTKGNFSAVAWYIHTCTYT